MPTPRIGRVPLLALAAVALLALACGSEAEEPAVREAVAEQASAPEAAEQASAPADADEPAAEDAEPAAAESAPPPADEEPAQADAAAAEADPSPPAPPAGDTFLPLDADVTPFGEPILRDLGAPSHFGSGWATNFDISLVDYGEIFSGGPAPRRHPRHPRAPLHLHRRGRRALRGRQPRPPVHRQRRRPRLPARHPHLARDRRGRRRRRAGRRHLLPALQHGHYLRSPHRGNGLRLRGQRPAAQQRSGHVRPPDRVALAADRRRRHRGRHGGRSPDRAALDHRRLGRLQGAVPGGHRPLPRDGLLAELRPQPLRRLRRPRQRPLPLPRRHRSPARRHGARRHARPAGRRGGLPLRPARRAGRRRGRPRRPGDRRLLDAGGALRPGPGRASRSRARSGPPASSSARSTVARSTSSRTPTTPPPSSTSRPNRSGTSSARRSRDRWRGRN